MDNLSITERQITKDKVINKHQAWGPKLIKCEIQHKVVSHSIAGGTIIKDKVINIHQVWVDNLIN